MKKKIKEKKAPIVPRLYLEYNEKRTGGEPLSEGPYSEHADEFIEVSFIRLHKEPSNLHFFRHSIEVDQRILDANLKQVYLAVVIYSTGSTFGYTEGAWYVVGVAPTYAIAEAMLGEALSEENKYKPWDGYFEKFMRTEIHKLDVE